MSKPKTTISGRTEGGQKDKLVKLLKELDAGEAGNGIFVEEYKAKSSIKHRTYFKQHNCSQ